MTVEQDNQMEDEEKRKSKAAVMVHSTCMWPTG